MNQQPACGLPQRFLRMCRRTLRRPKVADSTGGERTGGGLLARTWVLRRLLLRHGLGRTSSMWACCCRRRSARS